MRQVTAMFFTFQLESVDCLQIFTFLIWLSVCCVYCFDRSSATVGTGVSLRMQCHAVTFRAAW